MDMSVTLNPSYPAARPLSSTADKPAGNTLIDAAPDLSALNESGKEDLAAAVEKIDNYVNASRRTLDFSIDEQSGRVVVKVVATATGEVIRQLPSEEALKLAQNLDKDALRLFSTEV